MSSSDRRLILLRHGQTDWNAGGRMQGQLDTELTDLGRMQAKEAARELISHDPRAIIASDLRRAHDTALILGEASGMPVTCDARLRETHLGDWQGMTATEVDAGYPGARARWRADPRFTPPGGESKVAVAARGTELVRELVRTDPEWPGHAIVLVAHGGLIAGLTAALLGLPVELWPVIGGLSNASWVQLDEAASGDGRNPGWRLEVWNASVTTLPADSTIPADV